MAKIIIKDLPKDTKISRETMKRVMGGDLTLSSRSQKVGAYVGGVTLGAGNIAAPFIPGGAVVSAAISGLSRPKDNSGSGSLSGA
jgi:hypothetical protein